MDYFAEFQVKTLLKKKQIFSRFFYQLFFETFAKVLRESN